MPEVDRIEAIPVNCNKRCGLVEVAGHSKVRPKSCSLCGSSFAKTWDQLCCGGAPVYQGQAGHKGTNPKHHVLRKFLETEIHRKGSERLVPLRSRLEGRGVGRVGL